MPERWREALGRVDDLGPDGSLLDRARGGPQRPSPGPRPSSRVIAGVVAFAVFAAAGLFAFRALRPGEARLAGQTAGSPRIVWPERVATEARTVQTQADAGDPSVRWRLDPEAVATRFGSRILGWGDSFMIRPATGGPSGTKALELSPYPHPCPSPPPGGTGSVTCFEPVAVTVSLVQPITRGDGGVWSVSSVSASDARISPAPGGRLEVNDVVRADVRAVQPGAHLLLGLVVADGVKGIGCNNDSTGSVRYRTMLLRVRERAFCGADPIGYAYLAEFEGAPGLEAIVRPFDPLDPSTRFGSLLGLSIEPVVIGSPPPPGGPTASGTPSAGYFIDLPDQPEPVSGGDVGSFRIVAPTDLPDGTIFSTSTEVFGRTPGSSSSGEGSSGASVKDGALAISVNDSTCNGLVGAIGDSAGFTVTVTVSPKPVGAISVPLGSDYHPPQQPDSVIRILGRDFENLRGDQVVVDQDGSRSLVATATYAWPEPQCGSDPFPLWGGPDCHPEQGQLQGDSLKDAMGEVMGALTQARMCEFWGLELPPEVAAQHPWPEFSSQWRDWYTNPPKDFSDANSDASWDQPPVTWHETGRQGDRHFVDVTDHGQVILSLEVDSLPDYCTTCGANVVPFWGVVDWTFH